jgi:hypothetical protein
MNFTGSNLGLKPWLVGTLREQHVAWELPISEKRLKDVTDIQSDQDGPIVFFAHTKA